MRRLMILFSLLVLPIMACSLSGQTSAPTVALPTQPQADAPTGTPSTASTDLITQPATEAQTETPIPTAVIGTDAPANGQALEGPNINFNGIRFTLDPALGSRVYVFDDVITLEGKTAHNIRFALTPEEYCQTWCLMVYRVADFEQAFGTFIFAPGGYRGGASVIFMAREKVFSFQNGNGHRILEAFGQNHYGISNESLKYDFQGFDTDNQYAVYLQVPIHATGLLDAAPTMIPGGNPLQDILKHDQQATQFLEALTPADFTPNMDLLDALVRSIHVEAP
jgi:hypothetical protein